MKPVFLCILNATLLDPWWNVFAWTRWFIFSRQNASVSPFLNCAFTLVLTVFQFILLWLINILVDFFKIVVLSFVFEKILNLCYITEHIPSFCSHALFQYAFEIYFNLFIFWLLWSCRVRERDIYKEEPLWKQEIENYNWSKTQSFETQTQNKSCWLMAWLYP